MRISGFLWPVLLLFGHGLNAHPAGRQPTVQQRKLAALAPMHLSGTVLLPCMYCCASTPSGVLRCTSECSRSPTWICGAPNLGQQGVNGGGAGRLRSVYLAALDFGVGMHVFVHEAGKRGLDLRFATRPLRAVFTPNQLGVIDDGSAPVVVVG